MSAYNKSKDAGTTKICIKYKVNSTDQLQAEKISFPDMTEGYLVISIPNVSDYDSRNIDRVVKQIFEDPEVKIDGIYAEKSDDEWRLNIAFSPANYDKWAHSSLYIHKLKVIPPYFSNHTYSNRPNPKPNPGLTTQAKDDNSLYYWTPSYKSEATYTKEFDPSGWNSLVPVSKVSLPMSFYLFESEKLYENSMLSRVLLSPLAVATDVVTSPIQLIFSYIFIKYVHI